MLSIARFKDRCRRAFLTHRGVGCALARLAGAYRPMLTQTRFVAVTGSCGKTTTTTLVGAILGRSGAVEVGVQKNTLVAVCLTILRTRRRTEFCVQEVSGHHRGAIRKANAVFRPSIGVVTTVGYDHLRSMQSLEAIAHEKTEMVRGLPRTGHAILNADDERVRAMARESSAPVLLYGQSEDADVRIEEIAANWPDRLRMTVSYRGERVALQTRLVGEHWAPYVAAAIAVALVCGLSLQDCAEQVARAGPVPGRMEPIVLPGGVSMLHDAVKISAWSLPALLTWFGRSRARRRIAVIGTLRDFSLDPDEQVRQTIELARANADVVFLVGPDFRRHVASMDASADSRVSAFDTTEAACLALRRELRDGDLVLLKACRESEHLERAFLQFDPGVRCWSAHCGRPRSCQACRYLNRPAASSA